MSNDRIALTLAWSILAGCFLIGYGLGYLRGSRRGLMALRAYALRAYIESHPTPEPEVIYMARKPLTDAQLDECLKANGNACPRCTDDEDSTEGEIAERDDGASSIEMECGSCNQKWALVFTLNRVEPVED